MLPSPPRSGAEVVCRRGEPWFALERCDGEIERRESAVVGRVIWATLHRIVLNFGDPDLAALKTTATEVLEIDFEGDVRRLYPKACPLDERMKAAAAWSVESGELVPLVANPFQDWDDPDRHLFELERLRPELAPTGEVPHGVRVAPGSPVEIRRRR